MKKTSVLIFTAILSLFLFLIPMISAQWGGYSYYSPEALTELLKILEFL
jgi:hypothetical protein